MGNRAGHVGSHRWPAAPVTGSRSPPVRRHSSTLVQAESWAETLAGSLRSSSGGGRLFLSGPGPAPVERLGGLYRQQILVRTAGRRRLISAVQESLEAVEGKIPRRALVVDVDPYSLL